jgi:hypothetical protein
VKQEDISAEAWLKAWRKELRIANRIAKFDGDDKASRVLHRLMSSVNDAQRMIDNRREQQQLNKDRNAPED